MDIPPNFNAEAFEEARRMSAEYLGRLARASREQRQGLFVEWAERAYNLESERSIPLVKSAADLNPFLFRLQLYVFSLVMPLMERARPDEFEKEAIELAIGGRRDACLERLAHLLGREAAPEEPGGAEPRPDPTAAKRRAKVEEYRRDYFRVKNKRLPLSDFWKAAGYTDKTAFRRWLRNDPRASKMADRNFGRVLKERPHFR